MITDKFEDLLTAVVCVKKILMGIVAVASFEDVRFVVSDFTDDENQPEYVLNMTLHVNGKNPGKHLGQPLTISPIIIDQALAESKEAGYDDVATQIRIVAAILARGQLVKRLNVECVGGCPPEFKRLFAKQTKAWKEAADFEKTIQPKVLTHATPRKRL